MWTDLSMKDKSDLMSLFLKQGVSSLSDMRRIYDGTQDIEEEEYSGGNINASKVSTTLSRDQWNNLYRQGKVSLNEIPRKYQSWIEGENSYLKQSVTNAMNDVGYKIMPIVLGAATGGAGGAVAGLANIAFDMGVNTVTKGKSNSWGEALVNFATKGNAEEHPYWTMAAEVTNPLNYITFEDTTIGDIIKNLKIQNTPQSKVLAQIPFEEMQNYVGKGSQFRIVDKPAIDDAIKEGIIRARTGLYHGTPEYLEDNFGEVLKKYSGNWREADASDIRSFLEQKRAFNSDPKEAFLQKINIRNSTNHGGTVGFFKDRLYPNYNLSKTNYVIEVPTSNRFSAGHHGQLFNWDVNDSKTGATLLTTFDGNPKKAFITTKNSYYWKFNPENEMFEKFSFPKQKISFKDKYKLNINDDNSYFRTLIGGRGADEAINTGIIRGNPETGFGIPYFYKSKPLIPHKGDIIIKSPENIGNWDIKWIGVSPHQTREELLNTPIEKLIDFTKYGNSQQFTPLINGLYDNMPLTKKSSIYQVKNILGLPYYKKIFSIGGNINIRRYL